MLARFPQAVPEIPVRDVGKAAAYYVKVLGFQLDWHEEGSGIAGVSRGACRMFLTGTGFQESYGTGGITVVWLNVESRAEVDELFAEWQPAGARVLSPPADQPWNLREFRVADPDGNQLRVFYDFSRDV